MKVERDTEKYNKGFQEKVSSTESQDIHVGGFFYKDTVVIPNQNYLQGMASYFHEVGHILGKELSFINKEVLTPDEVKQTKIHLSFKDRFNQFKRILSKNEKPFNEEDQEFCNRIIDTYSKGNFDSSRIDLRCLSGDTFNEIVDLIPTGSTHNKGANGEIIPIGSKEGRDDELSSYATSIGCLTIFENSVSPQMSGENLFGFTFPKTLGSHQRALNLVAMSYERNDWIIPSELDLERR